MVPNGSSSEKTNILSKDNLQNQRIYRFYSLRVMKETNRKSSDSKPAFSYPFYLPANRTGENLTAFKNINNQCFDQGVIKNHFHHPVCNVHSEFLYEDGWMDTKSKKDHLVFSFIYHPSSFEVISCNSVMFM